ncbi:MAG: class I SAM-dependent RNA methyltransferase [Oscillospiraceae bacterium]|nr:class I SAM-dependent RNA methyltransferase [Oscillospiraceae bacterium]
MSINFVVPCLLGLEAPIADELRNMGAQNVVAENGRVLFSGDLNILARANINSRFAERVLILVGSFEAHSFEELFQGTRSLAWEEWIGCLDAFPVKGYSIDSDLFSVRDCQSIIKKAVVERLKQKYSVEWFEESGPVYQIQFSVMKNKVSLMIDTSGAGLHKRGYRLSANDAPIKETLAASLCYFSRLRPYHSLYDPMCGSGTILIEGAMMAINRAPGINRNFSAERWENIPRGVWMEERERARDLERRADDFFAYGSDISPQAIELASANACSAGVDDMINLKACALNKFNPSTERGTLICNPPYGERMLDIEQANELYRDMGRVFERRHGWSYSIITPADSFEKEFGRKADKRRKLYNGMIKCQLFMYFK